jgi:hypothetical protein
MSKKENDPPVLSVGGRKVWEGTRSRPYNTDIICPIRILQEDFKLFADFVGIIDIRVVCC